MSLINALHARGLKLDHRWFGLFLLLQGVVLTLLLLEIYKPLILASVGIAGGLFMALLLIYPWLLVPVIIVTTALDVTGRVIKATAVGVPLTGFHIAFLLMLIVLPIHVCMRRQSQFPDFELKGPLFLLLGIMAISLTYSPNQPEATIYFMRVLLLVLFMYLTQVLIYNRDAVNSVIYSMIVGVIGAAAMGAYQVATGEFHLPVRMVASLGANVPRATGTFHNPNIFGAFLVGCVVPLLGILLNCRLVWPARLVMGFACLAGFLGTLATFSRSNWMSLTVGTLVVLWMAKKMRYLFVFIVLVLIALLLLSHFVPFAAYVFDRFLSIFTLITEFGTSQRVSSSTRVYLVFAAWDMWLDNPLLGVGWRAFPVLLTEYAPQGYPWWSLVDESHTVLAAVLAELGLVGFLAMIWFIVRTLRISITSIRTMEDEYLRAFTIGLVAVFVSGQVNQSLNGDFSNNIFWFYTGLLFAVIRLERQARPA